MSVGDEARIDAVDAHAVAELAGFHRRDARHPVDRGFRAGVARDPGKAMVAATEEMLTIAPPLPAAPAWSHGPEGVFHAEPGADDIDRRTCARGRRP